MHDKVWWIVPTIFTVLCFAIAWARSDRYVHKYGSHGGGSYYSFDFFTPMIVLIHYIIALVLSLVSWLVFFIIF